ncbi:MAG TPA: hypothetical protein VF861_01300 [Telluria sp.]
MKHHHARWTAFALACLLAAGCKPAHEPVKPPVKPIVGADASAR